MKFKILLATSFLSLTILSSCSDEATDAPDMSSFSCTTESLDDDSGVVIFCGGDSIGVIMNGKDGKDGKDGKTGKDGKDGATGQKGKDGASCYIAENEDNDGYDVFCDDEKVGEIKNGKDGAKGDKGEKGDKGDDGKSSGDYCTVKENSEINGYDVICNDKKVGELRNGENGDKGEKGDKGDKGDTGDSCTVKENADINGYDVYCGKKKVGEIKNGEKGDKGDTGEAGKSAYELSGTDKSLEEWLESLKGDNGKSCTAKEVSNGIEVKCGDDTPVVVKNGNDGKSCTIKENTEKNGYDLTCDGNTVTVKNGDPGKEGKSAFDIAKEKDPNLTVDEWLASLKGDNCKGETLSNGNIKITCGSDFEGILEKGNDGASCTANERTDGTGYDLNCGGTIVTVKNGDPGKEGKSAFDIAKEKDPDITVDEWLASLKGDNCKGETLSNGNIKITCGSDFEGILEKGNDGASCTANERTDGTGYDLNCGGTIVTVKNGDPGKEGKSAFDIAKEKDPNLTVDEWLASLKGEGCTAKEVENGVEITCGNDAPVIVKNGENVISKVEVLSDACKTLRSTTDKFVPIFDILYCLRSNEKVTFILRHAARGEDTSESGTLSTTGENQCKEVGNKLKEMNLDDFSYMHTRFYRAKQTAWIIAKSKGQEVGSQDAWFNKDDTEFQITNDDLLDGWYVNNKDDNLKKTCKGNVSSGWGAYSRAAYKEYDNNNQKNACEAFLHDIDDKTQEVIKKHFTYDKMKPGVTIAISHDQFLAPFVISTSNRMISGPGGRDLRYHKYGTQEHWINYLSGAAIITDPDDNTIIIPATALSSGFLQ